MESCAGGGVKQRVEGGGRQGAGGGIVAVDQLCGSGLVVLVSKDVTAAGPVSFLMALINQ